MSRSVLPIALAVFLLDQAGKAWMVQNLPQIGSQPLIPGLLHLSLVHNRGGAFGLLPGVPIVFVAAGVLAILGILYLSRRSSSPSPWMGWALGLVLGGALGNLLDRVRLGYVVDFIDLCYGGRNIWPVFNLADSCITIGGAMLALALLRPGAEETSAQAASVGRAQER